MSTQSSASYITICGLNEKGDIDSVAVFQNIHKENSSRGAMVVGPMTISKDSFFEFCEGSRYGNISQALSFGIPKDRVSTFVFTCKNLQKYLDHVKPILEIAPTQGSNGDAESFTLKSGNELGSFADAETWANTNKSMKIEVAV